VIKILVLKILVLKFLVIKILVLKNAVPKMAPRQSDPTKTVFSLGVEAPQNQGDRQGAAKYSRVSTFLAMALSVCFLL